jgi:hypothetical protein
MSKINTLLDLLESTQAEAVKDLPANAQVTHHMIGFVRALKSGKVDAKKTATFHKNKMLQYSKGLKPDHQKKLLAKIKELENK